jgi:tetratricopeptide (TPR) repeat protein
LTALGSIATGEFKISESVEYLERAIKLNPSFATAYQWIGGLRLKTGETDAAQESYRKALDLIEKNSNCYTHIALTRPRNYRTANGLKFYCDPRFQLLVKQSSVPSHGRENVCD